MRALIAAHGYGCDLINLSYGEPFYQADYGRVAQTFTDATRKLERYTRACAAIENLLTFWESMNAIEQASRHNVSYLITEGEVGTQFYVVHDGLFEVQVAAGNLDSHARALGCAHR